MGKAESLFFKAGVKKSLMPIIDAMNQWGNANCSFWENVIKNDPKIGETSEATCQNYRSMNIERKIDRMRVSQIIQKKKAFKSFDLKALKLVAPGIVTSNKLCRIGWIWEVL